MREVSWGGRTTYLYLVKIKIHLMINSLVCVALPVLDTHPNPPKGREEPPPAPPKGGETKLAGNDEKCMINKIDLVN